MYYRQPPKWYLALVFTGATIAGVALLHALLKALILNPFTTVTLLVVLGIVYVLYFNSIKY